MSFTPGVLKTQAKEAGRLLGKLKFLEGAGQPDYRTYDISLVRRMTYREQWEYCLSNGYYDYRLPDSSLFQFFLPSSPGASYCLRFLDTPVKGITTYDEFFEQAFGKVSITEKASFYDYYEQHLTTLPAKESVTPIRYDFSPEQYRSCTHPAAHMHIGVDNQIRIACRRSFSVTAFVLFVVRQAYPEKWDMLITKRLKAEKTIRSIIRDDLPPVKSEYWTSHDVLQAYLE